jgi:hypothetical protein
MHLLVRVIRRRVFDYRQLIIQSAWRGAAIGSISVVKYRQYMSSRTFEPTIAFVFLAHADRVI